MHFYRDNLLQITAWVEEPLTHAGYSDRVQYIRDLIDAGEYKLALEGLCSNLYEFDCPIPSKAYALIEQVGTQAGVESRYWLDLQSLQSKSSDGSAT